MDVKKKLPTTSCRQYSKKHEKTIYYLNLFLEKRNSLKPKKLSLHLMYYIDDENSFFVMSSLLKKY